MVILALKPSLWFVPFDSLKWLAAGVVVLVGAALAGGPMQLVSYSALLQGTIVVVICRVAVALLRWVSLMVQSLPAGDESHPNDQHK